MSYSRNLYTELRSASRQQLSESVTWFMYVVLGGLLPIWGGYLLYLLLTRDITFLQFAGSGELALYSAALVTPALYLVSRDASDPFVHRGLFILSGLIFLSLSVLLFSAATSVTITPASDGGILSGHIEGSTQGLDTTLLIKLSSILLATSAIYAFLVNLLDVVLIGFDPAVNAADERKRLANAFRRAGGDDNGQD